MGASPDGFPLTCELRVIRAKNVEFVSRGSLFVRYYIPTDDGKSIRVTTREIPSTCDPSWNETISLECSGAKDVLNKLRHQSVLVELRWRETAPILGKLRGSKLLFSAEIGWKKALDSADLSVQEWTTSSVTSRYVPEGLKPPALQIEMKVQALQSPKKCHIRSAKWKECGCRHGECSNIDDDTLHARQH